MNIEKSAANSVLFLLMILCFTTVQVHAEISSRSLFAKSEDSFILSSLHRVQGFPANEQAGWRSIGYSSEFGNIILTIMAGVAGNVVGMYAGAFLGIVVPAGPFVGGIAGSACGSALGVYLAGSLGGRGGNFGSALLGSLLGEAAAVALAFIIPVRGESEFGFLTGFLILPPLGAALVFNSSRRSLSSRAGNGILNLANGKLGLGVPDVHIRPIFVPGLKAKPDLQFKLKVLSVEL